MVQMFLRYYTIIYVWFTQPKLIVSGMTWMCVVLANTASLVVVAAGYRIGMHQSIK